MRLLALVLAAAVDPSGILALFSPTGMARGCPIGETTVLTARHVAVTESNFGPRQGAFFWSDAAGVSGTAWTLDYDLRRDLALLKTDKPVSRFYRRAEKPPAIDDVVTIAGYKFNDRFQMKVLTAKILNIIAAHLILSEGAESGFSGSCVLNQRNEVVAVFYGSTEYRGTRRGIANGVWGDGGEFVGWMPPKPKGIQ
jgi:V8-like Glu-specific endopeptidase